MRIFGIIMLVIVGIVVLSVFGFMGTTCNNAQNQVQDHVVNNSFNSYEEFQELYNTCMQLNETMCNVKDVPDTDKMFDQFSKAAQMTSLHSKMNRWIQDYNAKSKMWNRSLWKSKSLPYQLDISNFNCY